MTSIIEISLHHHLYLGLMLFCIGFFGVLFRRNILIVLMSIEIMLNAVNLMLVAGSQYYGNLDGQIIVFFAMTIASAEVGVGLALAVQIYKRLKDVDIQKINHLHG